MAVFEYISMFFREVVFLFVEMAPYITLGLLIAGVMHVFLSRDFVARHVGGNNFLSVFKAALFGVPLPLCSCGVVPTAVYLKNSGASKSAVLSFLISTPQTGVDSITATWGMLGPLFAFFRALAALVTGVAGGAVNFMLDRFGMKSDESNGNPGKSEQPSVNISTVRMENEKYRGVAGKFRKIFDYAFFELLDDIAVNFLVGLGIAAVISIVIPEDFFSGSFLSNPLVSMILMVVIGIPMYICSTSSIPIAVAMIAKGLSPGAAYVFLVAGPATNAASLAIISRALGKKATVRYLGTIIVDSLIFGFVMNFIYTRLGLSPFGGVEHNLHSEHSISFFPAVVSGFFLIMLFTVLIRQIMAKVTTRKKAGEFNVNSGEEGNVIKIGIDGMNCGHCTASVEKALSMVKGVGRIDVSLEGNCAFLDGDFKVEEAEAAIKNAGYTVTENNAD